MPQEPSNFLSAKKKRSWSASSSSCGGSSNKKMMVNPRPLAVAGKFVYDVNNGGGRRRKTRHIGRRIVD